MLCEKCNGMLDLDNLMTEEGYKHHASYTDLVRSASSGCELCQCIKDEQALWAGGELDDAYDLEMPAEETEIRCSAFDRKENVQGIHRIRIEQHVRFMQKHDLDVKMPYLFVFLRFSTSASMHLFPFPKQ